MDKLFLRQDSLSIKGLRSECILGVYEWERKAPRKVLINLELFLTVTKSDKLEDTLDYAELTQQLDTHIRTSQFQLIESLAEHIAEFIITAFSVNRVRVEVIKPNVLKNVEQVSILIERSQ
ncbi:MAG: dienelactone hydrolase [Gammaproteobacteria bacterium]|jgi:dihydroneopterin aldolase|nr:dienelactone hydrolase [Gammaproteobacteria bacterium]